MDKKSEAKIQQLQASLDEKTTLLKEVYHRVKNNFQVIISLINLQIEAIEEPLAKRILTESITRIKTMVLIHEMLYQSANLAEIEMHIYIHNLLKFPMDAYNLNTGQIKLNIDVDPICLPADSAIVCGLIINEMVSNAFKHAFPNGNSGVINVSFKKEGMKLILDVRDNGIGIDDNSLIQSEKTLGIRLILSLSRQIGDEVILKNDTGTRLTVSFMLHSK